LKVEIKAVILTITSDEHFDKCPPFVLKACSFQDDIDMA